ISDSRDGAGKLTRAMQPSAPVAVQRDPPVSVAVNFFLCSRASRMRSGFLGFSRSFCFAVLRGRLTDLVARFFNCGLVISFGFEISCRACSGALAPEFARHEGSTPGFWANWPTPDRSFSGVLYCAFCVLR